jgi:hypothetical protein
VTAASLLVEQYYRKTAACVTRSASLVVFAHTPREISGNARIQGIINAFHNIKTPFRRSLFPLANAIHAGKIVTKMPVLINRFVSEELSIFGSGCKRPAQRGIVLCL